MDRRLPGPRELLLPALGTDVQVEERGTEHGELRRSALRPALPRDEGPTERREAPRADPRDARDPGAGAALDRALPPRELRALPRLDAQREIGRASCRERG